MATTCEPESDWLVRKFQSRDDFILWLAQVDIQIRWVSYCSKGISIEYSEVN